MSPVAGRMRPNTSASGIFSTKRRSAVNVSRLTRMLVPKPKKAFQSPGTQSLGLAVAFMVVGCVESFWARGALRHGRKDFCGVRDPAEDAALRLDHLQAHLLELREVGAHAIGRHEAV